MDRGLARQGRDRRRIEPGHRLRDRAPAWPPKARASRWSRAAPSRWTPRPHRIRDETGARGLRRRRRHPQGGGLRSASSQSRSRISAASTCSSTTTARRRSASSMSFDDAAWDKAVQQNFMSVVRLPRGAVPPMRAAGGGRIVNITALSALQPMPQASASRSRPGRACIGYAKTLSLEVAADKHHRQHDLPGPHRHRTPRQGLRRRRGSARTSRTRRCAPCRRKFRCGASASRDEIAGLVALLASPIRRLHHRRDASTSTAGGGRACYDRARETSKSVPGTSARSTSSALHARLPAAARLLPQRLSRCRATSCARCRRGAFWRP